MQQLDVFLQSETQSFVDILFKVIDNKEYINPPKQDQIENVVTETTKLKQEEKEESKLEEDTARPEADSTTPIREPETKFKEERRKSPPPPPPPGEERGPPPRRFRSSPPPITDRLGPMRPRRHERQMRSPPRRFRSRSPSPRHDRFRPVRRRTRSPPRFRPRSFSRSPVRHRPRSLSPPPRGRDSRDSTPTKDEGATAGYTPTAKRPRCRDYDEKGFCLRGDLCKFDHGNDAVVLEDSTKPGVPPYQPGPPPPPGTEPYIPGIPPTSTPGIPFPPPVMSVPPPGYPATSSYLGKRPHDGAGYAPPAKRFDYNRLGGRGRGRGRGRGGAGASPMLAVRNIP